MELSSHPLRPDWKVGGEVDVRDAPPELPDQSLRCLYGIGPDDWEPRLYAVPLKTPHHEIIEFFEVGTHNAIGHGWDELETMDLVTSTLNQIDSIVPGSIELASSSELRFRFWRKLRIDEIEEMEDVYRGRKVDDYQAGLERYINSGLSGSSILHDVMDSGLLHLRWR